MSKHILLVDDNPAVRKFLRNYLESEPGIEVCGEACDGIDAVDKALTLGPDLVDLVVMDLSMPQMNGLKPRVSSKRSCRACRSFFLPRIAAC